MKKLGALIASLAIGIASFAPMSFAQDKGMVGISMPTKTSTRWIASVGRSRTSAKPEIRTPLSSTTGRPLPRPPLLPGFAVGFALLVVVNSSGWLPAVLVQAGQGASQFLLVASMAAIGMKTQLRDIVTVGWKPVALMVLETVFLAALFWGLLRWA